MDKTCPKAIVCIKWEDHCIYRGWCGPKEIKSNQGDRWIVENIGYLIADSAKENYILISSEARFDDDEWLYNDVFRILRSDIISQRTLIKEQDDE